MKYTFVNMGKYSANERKRISHILNKVHKRNLRPYLEMVPFLVKYLPLVHTDAKSTFKIMDFRIRPPPNKSSISERKVHGKAKPF